jgi:hypothetical protein
VVVGLLGGIDDLLHELQQLHPQALDAAVIGKVHMLPLYMISIYINPRPR